MKPLLKEHPWVTKFRAAPLQALDRLLRRVAYISPYERADPADVLEMFFAGLPDNDSLRVSLDIAMTEWLEAQRMDGPEQRYLHGMDRYLEELIQALTAVYRVPLLRTASHLRNQFGKFHRWLNALSKGPGQDPAGELWRIMALTQTDRRFLEDWYQMCAQSGNTLPEDYLSTGMLGLRLLPQENGKPSGRLNPELLAGLFKWGRTLTNHERDRQAFIRRLRSIKALYPRSPSTWRDLLAPLIEQHKDAVFLPWIEQAGIRLERITRQRRPGAAPLPPKSKLDALLQRLEKEPVEKGLPDIRVLMIEHERHAEATGDAYYLVQAADKFGRRLIRHAPYYALELARMANHWEPYDPYTWTLWAEALEVLGRQEFAEMVYWEGIRRFPENPFFRTQLAKLLAARTNRLKEAEAILRETMQRFPDNEVCRNALADLLARTGREEEAEIMYWKLMKDFPNNQVHRNALAELLAHTGREEEAERIYWQTMKDFPRDDVCRNALADLLARTGREEKAEHIYRQTMKDFPRDDVCRKALAFWLLRWDRLEDAEELYQKVVSRFTEDRYTRRLKELIDEYKAGNKTEFEIPEFTAIRAPQFGLGLIEEQAFAEEVSKADETNSVEEAPEGTIEISEGEASSLETGSAAGLEHKPATEAGPEGSMAKPTTSSAIVRGESLPGLTTTVLNAEFVPDLIQENMAVSRADFRLRTEPEQQRRHEVISKLKDILQHEPEHIYARLVLGLHDEDQQREIASQIAAFPHAYSLRFLAARQVGGRQVWDELFNGFREHWYLTILGHLLVQLDTNDTDATVVELHQWSNQTAKLRKGFENFVQQRLRRSLFAGMNGQLDLALFRENLRTNRNEIEILVQDGLKRTVDENVRYAA